MTLVVGITLLALEVTSRVTVGAAVPWWTILTVLITSIASAVVRATVPRVVGLVAATIVVVPIARAAVIAIARVVVR